MSLVAHALVYLSEFHYVDGFLIHYVFATGNNYKVFVVCHPIALYCDGLVTARQTSVAGDEDLLHWRSAQSRTATYDSPDSIPARPRCHDGRVASRLGPN